MENFNLCAVLLRDDRLLFLCEARLYDSYTE